MKKKFLAGLSLFLTFSLISNTTFASETILLDEVDENFIDGVDKNFIGGIDKILIDFGYDADDIQYYPDHRKHLIAKAIKENPETVERTTSYLSVDNIELIEYYVNTSDEMLSEDGVTEDEINLIRSKLEMLNSMPDSELETHYNISEGEMKIIREALRKKRNYKAPSKFDEKEVTTSGTIATSKMTFTMTRIDQSTSKAPKYSISMNHNWKTPFFFDITTDNVAIAWGGNFDTKDVGSLIQYYNGNWYSGSYGSLYGYAASPKNETPNVGIVFSFPQSHGFLGQRQAKAGSYWLTLFQTKKQGYSTSVVSRYAHKVAKATNMTVSSSPGIVIGSGKDTSPQNKINLLY